MAYNPNNPNGQATAANSQPVVIASDQLPAAATLADATSTPTTTTVAAALVAYDSATSTWDRVRNIQSVEGTGVTDTTGVLAVAQVPRRLNPTALGTATNSVSTLDINGEAALLLSINTTTTGTFVIEATGDGTNWGFPEVYDTGADIWITGTSITPTVGKNYQIVASAFRQVRIRTNATLGATVTHFFTQGPSQPVLSALRTAPAPHMIGYTIINKNLQFTAAQTGGAVWTPATGKKIAVMSLQIQAGGTVAGSVQVWYGGSADTAFTRGTDYALFDGEFAPSATNKPGVILTPHIPFVSPTVDFILRITSSAAINPLTVSVWGYEF